MKHWKRITVLLLAVCMCFSLFACWGKGGSSDDESLNGMDEVNEDGTVTYTVQMVSEGGMAFEGVGIYIYEDETLEELVWFDKTDAQGKMSFTAQPSGKYVAILDKVPEGYELEAFYPLTGKETLITLTAALVSDYAGKTFQLGDVMCDLTITDVSGKTYQLSELLKEKKAVMLNFWFRTCTPCRQEFPYLLEAYEKYSDDVEVLALNPIDTDEKAVQDYVEEMKLTVPTALCDGELETALKVLSYPTTIIIDRYGVISLVHTGSITSTQTFEDIFAHFTAEDYVQGVVKDVEEIMTSDGSDEDEIQNPTEVSGVTSFQLTVRPGEVVYCDLYRLTDVYMQIKSPNAYLIYKGKTYNPTNGTIGLAVSTPDTRTPVAIGLGNTGDETETFTITLGTMQGSLNNPYAMSLGEFDVSIPSGKQEGIYYRYTAQEDGYLVVQCLQATSGVPYGYTLYNLNSYANRNLESDAIADEDGNAVVRIQVKAGQVVQFNPSAMPDDGGNYPSIQMRFLAKMEEPGEDDEEEAVEKQVYGLTITDEFRKPIEGVHVTLTYLNEEAEADTENTKKNETNLTSNSNGNAAAELAKGTYKAVIKVPVGYIGRTTEVMLTEQMPILAIKLDVDESMVQIPYTVKVKDESGVGIGGVLISMGGKTGTTDANGSATITLPKNDGGYTAVIAIPDGYTADTMAYPFPSGTTTLEITLKKGSSGDGPSQGAVDHTVTVTDYDGNIMTGVSVTFLKDGNVVGLKTTDASGKAVMSLEKGKYTVELAFSGNYYYDPAQAVLTAETTSITLRAVPKRGNDYTSLYVGDAFHLNVGGTYVENMQANVVNYFIFWPAVSGVYQFTTSDPAAEISYWGANDAYIANQTSTTDYKDNAFTREIREDQTQSTMIILGVTGAEGCVVEINRIGDIQLSPEDQAEWIVFAGTQTPAAGTTYRPSESGRLTYVNVQGKTEDYQIVKGSDGFYHLGSATGPLMYVNLGPNGRYVSFYQMMGFEQAGGTSMRVYFYDEEGNFLRKEEYTECFQAYISAVDADGLGIYPLTDDLIYILKSGGDYKEWWDAESYNYLFEDLDGVNTEIAWMFNCCYF